MLNMGAPPKVQNTLTSARDGAIIVLHEYRHDSNVCDHQLVMKVTLDGFELVCSRCRSEDKKNSRILITWNEIILYLLMAMRMRR